MFLCHEVNRVMWFTFVCPSIFHSIRNEESTFCTDQCYLFQQKTNACIQQVYVKLVEYTNQSPSQPKTNKLKYLSADNYEHLGKTPYERIPHLMQIKFYCNMKRKFEYYALFRVHYKS